MGTETCLRLPGSNPALSVIAEQWERLALDVVSEAGSIRDVTVCQHPIFNFLRTIRRLLAENPKDQISLFFQWFPPVRCRFAAAPSQRWAGYMGGVPDCQRSKVTKATFFASGPSAAPAPVVESLIARAFRESHLVFGKRRFNRRTFIGTSPRRSFAWPNCFGAPARWYAPDICQADDSGSRRTSSRTASLSKTPPGTPVAKFRRIVSPPLSRARVHSTDGRHPRLTCEVSQAFVSTGVRGRAVGQSTAGGKRF